MGLWLLVVQEMIQVLVFSKDRALQLEACLGSFWRNASGTDAVRLEVIYAASSSRFLRQYGQLARWYGAKARFVHQAEFRNSVLGVLMRSAASTRARGARSRHGIFRRQVPKEIAPVLAAASCILFLVDDTIFVRAFDLTNLESTLSANHDALGCSLRLGSNTTESYVLGRQQAVPPFLGAGNGYLCFDWTKADGDFGYPLEVSSSLYRMADLLPVLRGLKFHDPNTLESMLSLQAKRLARRRPALLCPEVSVAFSVPINRVQEVFENRSGTDPQWSTERLAEHFDRGLRIDVARLDGFTPSACHQEVELSFEPRT